MIIQSTEECIPSHLNRMLLVKALQYVKAFDGTIIQIPDDKSIQPHGLMNEGLVSTRLGLAGKPSRGQVRSASANASCSASSARSKSRA